MKAIYSTGSFNNIQSAANTCHTQSKYDVQSHIVLLSATSNAVHSILTKHCLSWSMIDMKNVMYKKVLCIFNKILVS